MIQERDEYQIYFTRDDIREAAGDYERVGLLNGGYEFHPADLTDEQCDEIAYALADLFEDEFRKNVREMEV